MLKWTKEMRAEHIKRSREAALAVLPGLIATSGIQGYGPGSLQFAEGVAKAVEEAWVIGEAFTRQAATIWVRLEAEALAEDKEEPCLVDLRSKFNEVDPKVEEDIR